ncbi:hypothetical protein HMPREF3144_06445 [Oligella sp. HMSC05A10]|nr:hypothetical protein HMPREF3144_06445 [Oligella sp. HMSC05A10]
MEMVLKEEVMAGLLDTLHADNDEGRQLRGGLLNMGIGLLSGSTGHYGQFAPALAQGFAGFQQGQQQVIDDRFKKAQAEQMQALRNMQMQTMARAQNQEDEAQNIISSGIDPQTASRHGNPIVREYGQKELNRMHQQEQSRTTPLMRNLIAAGLQPGTPEFQDAMLKGTQSGTTVNVGGDSAPGLGKLSTDYGYVFDPTTRQPVIDQTTGLPQAAPIPGSPAAQAIKEAEEKAALAQANEARAGGTVVQDIGRALQVLNNSSSWATGRGAMLSKLDPESDASTLQGLYDSILGNVGFDYLQSMREASPTGGALGAVNSTELAFLQGVLGRLDITSRRDIQIDNLKRINNIYLDKIHGTPEQIMAAYNAGIINPRTGKPLTLEDIAPLVKRYELSFDDSGDPIDTKSSSIKTGSKNSLEEEARRRGLIK